MMNLSTVTVAASFTHYNIFFYRHKLAFSQSRITSYLFDGTGFALVNNIERRGRIGIVTRFDIEVRTVANNGILFLMVNGVIMFIIQF